MRIIKVTKGRVRRSALSEAAAVLGRGGVVVFPTETSYGLAADPRDRAAVRAVFGIKGRPAGKPLPLVAASFDDVRRAFDLRGRAAALARRHWPGPLTLVLKARDRRLVVRAADGTCAVRVPASAWARAVARAAGGLATSTSANVSGEEPVFDPRRAVRAFKGRPWVPDLLLDAGTLPRRPPSTIVRVRGSRWEVLRQGRIRV